MNSIYTLKDLHDWEQEGVSLAVIGNPVKHSISPNMHNAALALMPGFEGWRYYKFEIGNEDLAEALKVFKRKGFVGVNVTIPHKVEVVKYLEHIDPVAKKMGAVNTLKLEGKSYRGYNTDGYGLEAALKRDLGVNLKGRVVILLGAGGAAKAAAMQCLLSGVEALWIGNRNMDRLDGMMRSLGTMARGVVRGFNLMDLPKDLPKKGVLINGTSLGMHVGDGVPIDLGYFSRDLKVMDMIYNPVKTELLESAESYGMTYTNGLSMLVEQGARSLNMWTKEVVPLEVMHQAAKDTMSYLC